MREELLRLGRTAMQRRWSWAAATLCVVVLLIRFAQIDASLPYIYHPDERYVTKPALRVLQGPDRNPKFFNYGSLPIYATAAAISVGAVRAARHGELDRIQDLRPSSHYYAHPRVMGVARKLHAAVGVLLLWLVGALAARTFKEPSLRILAPLLVLLLSPSFSRLGWAYINVDVWAATFSAATLVWLASTFHQRNFTAQVLVPAALAAAAVASKYTAAVIVIPCLLAIGLQARNGHRILGAAQFLALLCGFFLLFCPYALFDTPRFLNAVLHEAHHYATGHRRFTVEAGWPHLRRIGETVSSELGFLPAAAIAVGLVGGFRVHARRTLLLVSFVGAAVTLMSGQRVFFPRNLTSILAVLAPIAAYGLLLLLRWSRSVLGKLVSPRWRGHSLLALQAAVVPPVILLPIGVDRFVTQVTPAKDTRNQAVELLEAHLRSNDIVLVDRNLHGDWRALPRKVVVRTIDVAQAGDRQLGGNLLVLAERSKVSGPLKRRLKNAELLAHLRRPEHGTRFDGATLRVYRLAPPREVEARR